MENMDFEVVLINDEEAFDAKLAKECTVDDACGVDYCSECTVDRCSTDFSG